jgi:hypothetical protein
MKALRLYVSRFETLILYISGPLALAGFGGLMLSTNSPHGYIWGKYSCYIFLLSTAVWLGVMMTQKKTLPEESKRLK